MNWDLADFRLVQYQDIEKWWEIVFSAYFLVSLFTLSWNNSENPVVNIPDSQVRERMEEHPQWDNGFGWKNLLNNLRLISLPLLCFNLILPWLNVFPIPQLSLGFPRLIALMNFFPSAVPQTAIDADFQFSSA